MKIKSPLIVLSKYTLVPITEGSVGVFFKCALVLLIASLLIMTGIGAVDLIRDGLLAKASPFQNDIVDLCVWIMIVCAFILAFSLKIEKCPQQKEVGS